MNNHAYTIEAILFALGKPMTYQELSNKSGLSAQETKEAIASLRERQGGVVLIDDGHTVVLRIAGALAPIIETIQTEEYARDIGKAGLETLAAVLYKGPLSRSEIDFIRGVNSSQTLRTLVMRGLLRKVPHPRHQRSFLFEPTTELLAHLGITDTAALPHYDTIREKLTALQAAYETQTAEHTV